VSRNANVVKIYNTVSSKVRFENKNILFCLINALAYNAGAVGDAVGIHKFQSRWIGSRTVTNVMIFKTFSPKNLAENRRFLIKLLLVLRNFNHNIGI
jgi:hypothetical protein